MKFKFNTKYSTISIYTIITFAICLLMVVLVQNFSIIASFFKTIATVLAPITWGIVISYVMNPVMMATERLMKKIFDKKKPHPKLTRGISVIFSIILLLAILTAIVSMLIPQIIDSIMGIVNNSSTYLSNLEEWIYKFVANYPEAASAIENQFDTLQPKLVEYANNLIPQLTDLAVKLKDGAIVFVLALKDFIIGFIVAIYLLCSKELFLAQARKVIYAVFPKGFSESFLRVCYHTNKTLGGFISGKLIDSLIIGIIAFIAMTIMKMEFVALISFVIGITNIIPFFGPFIGAIPSALLLLMAAPKQVIPFVIFIFILQQFDGNILGPKILGESTGLSSFWVMFAIFVGGGLFGFAGMLLGVPLFAVIYTLVSDLIEFLLDKKGMPVETSAYYKEAEENNHRSDNTKEPNFFEKLKKVNTSENNEKDVIEDGRKTEADDNNEAQNK